MDMQILECRLFTGTYVQSQKERTVKDYEIDLELGNRREVVIDGVRYTLQRGDVCIRRPGQRIRGGDGKIPVTQTTILLTVDFSGRQTPGRYSRHMGGLVQDLWELPLLEQTDAVVRPHSETLFLPIYRELLKLPTSEQKSRQLLVMELIYRINAEVCRQVYNKNKPAETPCAQALQYMKDHLERNIGLDQLAQQVHLNKNYLVRLFRENYGRTPIQMLIDLRMERGCDLIANTDMPVAEVAQVCGYASAAYFIAEYKKHFGITPLRQRQQEQ